MFAAAAFLFFLFFFVRKAAKHKGSKQIEIEILHHSVLN